MLSLSRMAMIVGSLTPHRLRASQILVVGPDVLAHARAILEGISKLKVNKSKEARNHPPLAH